MPSDHDEGRWRAIGEQLTHRRVELDIRYKNLTLFTEEQGIDYRLAWDIENGRRGNYRTATLTALDIAYGLPPGTLRALAAGLTIRQAAALRNAPAAFAALAEDDDGEDGAGNEARLRDGAA